MPFHYQAPHIMPHQETYIEYRVMVPVHEHGLKDGTPYTKSYFIHPQIKNPFYNGSF